MNKKIDSSKKGGSRGFTLLEMMIVIVILGILAGLVAPQLMDEPQKARVVKARIEMENIETALKKFYLDNGYYPSTEQGLKALVSRPSVGRVPKSYPPNGYLNKVPNDPWQGDYIYISPGANSPFELYSYGGDGKEGGSGNNADIKSEGTR
ncbi:type II secretion system major pseudopilin GspG [Maridesulfovibrio bastinii]|uniref:type II secretion system major pseudopilin GspG n=1 Tax=Maridesulfovibrio bastinii TaxID=47157 RepID=UPI000489E229|nr:type II secretion system major pseudopilin GspG [Maridesulfovibrio bastinii]